jgi:hypothetical protein
MMGFIWIGCIFLLWGMVSVIRFKPQITRTGHLIVFSYLVQDRYGDYTHRNFIVFNTITKTFV